MKPEGDFEELLRHSLSRQAAPNGFAERVLAQTRRMPVEITRPAVPWPRRPLVLAAVAAGVLLAALGPVAMVAHRRHERAVEARRQLVEALQITRTKLIATRHKIQRKHS